MLYWMYALIILSGVVILGVSTYAMIKSPKGSYKVLIAVAGMVVLVLLTYLLSTNTYGPAMLEKYSISANGVRWVGAGLLTAYIFLAIAILSLIFSSVSKFLK
jgi:hypothetical protein